MSIESIAKLLAHEHTGDHPLDGVYWLPGRDDVLLVIVSPLIAEKGEALPFRFAPEPPDIPCKYTIVLLSERDWERRHRILWPKGIDVDKLELISKGDND